MPRRTSKNPAAKKPAPAAAKKPATATIPHDDVAREAFKLYQSRHGAPGDPVADWFEATRIVNARVTVTKTAPAPKAMTAEAAANGGSRSRARSRRRSRK
jgi:hypothetical protein